VLKSRVTRVALLKMAPPAAKGEMINRWTPRAPSKTAGKTTAAHALAQTRPSSTRPAIDRSNNRSNAVSQGRRASSRSSIDHCNRSNAAGQGSRAPSRSRNVGACLQAVAANALTRPGSPNTTDHGYHGVGASGGSSDSCKRPDSVGDVGKAYLDPWRNLDPNPEKFRQLNDSDKILNQVHGEVMCWQPKSPCAPKSPHAAALTEQPDASKESTVDGHTPRPPRPTIQANSWQRSHQFDGLASNAMAKQKHSQLQSGNKGRALESTIDSILHKQHQKYNNLRDN